MGRQPITKPHKMTDNPKRFSKMDVIDRILVLTHPGLMGIKDKNKKTIQQACEEIGITKQAFYKWLKEDPVLREKFENAIEVRKESIRLIARENVFEGIDGTTKLKPKEKIELSKWMLEKTDKTFNPKSEVELKSMNLNFDVPIEELELRIKNLMNK